MATQPLASFPIAPLSYPEAFRHCVAEILRLSVEETPDIPATTRGEWNLRWRQWLADQGWIIRAHIVGTPLPSPHIIATISYHDGYTPVVCNEHGLTLTIGKVSYYQSLMPIVGAVPEFCLHSYLHECEWCQHQQVDAVIEPKTRWGILTQRIKATCY